MVRLDGVTKRYGQVVALAELELSVGRGEFVTLLGPSGSGKTTVLNLISGMAAPTSGRIWIGGRDMTELPPNKRGLGMVFQNYALLPHMTVFENIAFPLRVRKLPEQEIRRKVSDILDLIALPAVSARKPRELSGGQQQRIALARCLVYDPALILMDEPLGAMDKKLREQMQVEIKRLHSQLGVTILYVTHDQEEALSMSDRIVLMRNGRLVQAGTPAELYFNPRSVFAASFLGASNLLHARIAAAKDHWPGNVLLATGEGVVASDGGRTGLADGAAVRVLVRPESVSVVDRGGVHPGMNTVAGTMVVSMILGSVTHHHARLADGTVMVAQALTRAGTKPLSPGTPVRLAWAASDTMLLEDDASD